MQQSSRGCNCHPPALAWLALASKVHWSYIACQTLGNSSWIERRYRPGRKMGDLLTTELCFPLWCAAAWTTRWGQHCHLYLWLSICFERPCAESYNDCIDYQLHLVRCQAGQMGLALPLRFRGSWGWLRSRSSEVECSWELNLECPIIEDLHFCGYFSPLSLLRSLFRPSELMIDGFLPLFELRHRVYCFFLMIPFAKISPNFYFRMTICLH